MINYNFDKKLFIKISTHIKKNIMKNINLYYNNKKSNIIYNNLNLCNDSEKELIFLNNVINIIKKNNPTYCNAKIYLVVLYLYYGLVLEEQTENYLIINDIKNIIANPYNKIEIYKELVNLIFEISSSEKEYCSKIRQIFFNFTP
jgi:hypothetical protein